MAGLRLRVQTTDDNPSGVTTTGGVPLTFKEGDSNFIYLLTHLSGSNVSIDGATTITGNTTLTGNLTLSNGSNITLQGAGKLIGTSSWAENALTAASATTASYITSSFFTGVNAALSASYALTASYVSNIDTNIFITTGSASSDQSITGSLLISGSSTKAFSVSGAVIFPTLTSESKNWVVTYNTASGQLYYTASSAIGGGGNANVKASSSLSSEFGGTPKTASVTFTTAFPNTSYTVNIIGEDARVWTIQDKLPGSFTINSNSSVSLSNPVYWIATQFNNS